MDLVSKLSSRQNKMLDRVEDICKFRICKEFHEVVILVYSNMHACKRMEIDL